MIDRLNKYLLTHHPLLWNMRVLPLVICCLLIHLLFFIAGFMQLDAHSIQSYYSVWSVGDSSLYTMSILLSSGVVIIWLVHYLRNNAFKNFYVIDRWFLARQFLLLCVSLYVSLAFFHSFHWGAAARTRSITSRSELVSETNIINLAARFIPLNRNDFFKLNTCDSTDRYREYKVNFAENTNYYDSSLGNYNDSIHQLIRSVLKDPDAFVYTNYCYGPVMLDGYKGWLGPGQQRRIGNGWIEGYHADSIRAVLNQAMLIGNKYGLPSRLHADSLASRVFADSMHTVSKVIGSVNPDNNSTERGYEVAVPVSANGLLHAPGTDYFQLEELRSILAFIESSHSNTGGSEDETTFQTVFLYIVICLAILLFCYRLFTKRVFMFSLVGTIIWSILFFLMMSGSGALNAPLVILLLLFAAFGLLPLASSLGKTLRGVALNWHVWLAPFVGMIVIELIQQDYNSHFSYSYINNGIATLTDAQRAAMYPIGYWVNEHAELLLQLNIPVLLLYVSLVFTKLARNWHISADE